VLDEGQGLEDVEGSVTLSECLRLCEARADCASLAHGPHGCHLKDRCVSPRDVLAPAGWAPGYRTYYRAGGPCLDEAALVTGGAATLTAAAGLGEVQVFVDLAAQLLEHAAHCLDASDWPLSVAEVMENRVNFVEASLRGRHTQSQAAFRWRRTSARVLPFGSSPQVEVGSRAVQRALDRLSIRWVRGLDAEVGFWHALLDPGARDSPDVDAAAWKAAQHWLATGEVSWHCGDVCGYLAKARAGTHGRHGHPRVLNAGSGPLAPGPLECNGERLHVVAADGLARFYLQLYDILSHRPPATPVQCPAESLPQCFPRHHFDVVYMRNALDHAGDPLLGLRQMLEVVRPGGWVLLRHARNEGVPGQFQLGLHQWAFDVVEGPEEALHFIIWNPSLRVDASLWLLGAGLAAEVQAELRPHPGGEDRGEQYVWVDIRKPE